MGWLSWDADRREVAGRFLLPGICWGACHDCHCSCCATRVQEGRAWVEAVQRRDWEKVVPAHASVTPQLLRDGRAAFAACFAFLYE